MYYDWGGGWVFMWIGMGIFWALLIGVTIWLVRTFSRTDDGRESARRILRERLARGELDAEEFRAKLAQL